MGGNGGLSHDEILQAERGMDEIYRREAEQHRKEWQRTQAKVGLANNTSLHRKGTGANPAATDVLPLIGRVGLTRPDVDLGMSFYIGHEHCELPGDVPIQVISWAAPLARTFYRGATAEPDPEVGQVAVTRSFQASSRTLLDFADDLSGPEVVPEEVFVMGASERLDVPTAPGKVGRPVRRDGAKRPAPAPASRQQETSKLRAEETSMDPPNPVREAVETRSTEPKAPARRMLRASGLVNAAVTAPRTGKLRSILSTLQGNQYELVTWPSMKPLVIQGAPGTGKTIVATHRAAYLVNRFHREDRSDAQHDPGLPLDEVALIGPTAVWAAHVRTALEDLEATDHVTVIALDEMIQDLAGRMVEGRGPWTGERGDTTSELARFLDAASRDIAGRQAKGKAHSVKEIMRSILKERSRLCHKLNASEEVRTWLGHAETWRRMRQEGRYIQALAVIGSTIGRGYEAHKFQHIVVDEAQDLSPMEWWLVNRIHAFGATMTLVGDLQQRRSDWSPMSWHEVDEIVELSDGINELNVQTLDLAYRSTTQILRFASQLLPKGTPVPDALQSGPEVEVIATQGDVTRGLGQLVDQRLEDNPDGLLAIISVEPDAAVQALRHTDARWRSPGTGRLQRDDRQVWVLNPDQARGLEFDSVIAVEPADFPQNLGRSGPLYTSLTRATRDLSVVHAKPLPMDLRPPKHGR